MAMSQTAPDRPPTIDEWRALYDAALKFRDLACWQWLYDSDIIGVENPESGEIGYCSVMGRNGQHFALAAHRGTPGLLAALQIYSGQAKPSAPEAPLLLDCLMASFEDREALRTEDLQAIRYLGLKFRGANAWPLFRDYHPGDFPWLISGAQARYLTLALEQTLDVAPRFRDGRELPGPEAREHLVRVRSADGAWTDEYRAPAMPPVETLFTVEPVNEVRIEKVRSRVKARTGDWEADAFHHFDPVQDKRGGRPYYPYILAVAAAETGLVLSFAASRRGDHVNDFRDALLDAFESAGALPVQIHYAQTTVADVLRPVTDRLAIELKRAKALPAAWEFRDNLQKQRLQR
jgi:hypothetical protein